MRLTAPLAAALLLAACGGSPDGITGPLEQSFMINGLEQQITVSYPPAGDPDPDWVHLTSRIINRGDAPVQVQVVTCWLDPRVNLRTRAEFNSYAIPGCAAPAGDNVLAPGEASATASFSGRIEGRGRYRIEVRQLLDPEFWGAVEVVAR